MITLSNGCRFWNVLEHDYCPWIREQILSRAGRLVPSGAPVSQSLTASDFEETGWWEWKAERLVNQAPFGAIIALEGSIGRLNVWSSSLGGLPLVALELRVLCSSSEEVEWPGEIAKTVRLIVSQRSHPIILNLAIFGSVQREEWWRETVRRTKNFVGAYSFARRNQPDCEPGRNEWPAIGELVKGEKVSVIMPDLRHFEEIALAQNYGGEGSAVSWGQILRHHPSRPYRWVRQYLKQPTGVAGQPIGQLIAP